MESSVRMGTTTRITTASIGDFIGHTIVSGIKSHIEHVNVLHIPTFHFKLISDYRIVERWERIIFRNSFWRIEVAGSTVASRSLVNDPLYIKPAVSSPSAGSSADFSHSITPAASLPLWHKHLAHVSKSGIEHMASTGVVTDVNLNFQEISSDPCQGCGYGKEHSVPIPTASRTRSTDLL